MCEREGRKRERTSRIDYAKMLEHQTNAEARLIHAVDVYALNVGRERARACVCLRSHAVSGGRGGFGGGKTRWRMENERVSE